MAITTMDGLVAAMATSQKLAFYTPSFTTATGSNYPLNMATPSSFGTMALPALIAAGGTTYSQATPPAAGTLGWTAAAVGNTTYLSRLALLSSVSINLFFYDLLWGVSGLSSGGGTQTISWGSGAGLPARAGSPGVAAELWVFNSASWPSVTITLTVSYTNQSGVSGRSATATFYSTRPAWNASPMVLQSGDTGVQSIQSVSQSANSGSTNYVLLLMNRITHVYLPTANVGGLSDFAGTGLPIVSDAAVPFIVANAASSASGNIFGQTDIAQG